MKNRDNRATPVLLVILVGLYPYYFLFFRNIGKIRFSETLSVFSILIVFSLLLVALIYLFVRDMFKAGILASVLSVFLLYFENIVKGIERILPFAYYWHVLYVGLVLFILLAILISRKVSGQNAIKLCNSLLIVAVGLFLFNLTLAAPNLKEELMNPKEEIPTTMSREEPGNQSQSEIIQPNVYYFIFDEYGGQENLLRYCNYDNTPFIQMLESLGFKSSRSSMNETSDTLTEIPNLLQLSRVNTIDMSALERRENFKNPRLIEIMREQGYSINLIDTTNYEFLDLSVADYFFESNFSMTYRTFDSYIWSNSVVYPFINRNDHDQEREQILSAFNYAIITPTIQSNNLFTLGYFYFPHIPYVFDKDGNKTNSSDRTNLKDSEAYLNQLLYANKLIENMLREILDADPNAVIIIQSDHGFRYASHLAYWYKIYTYNLQDEVDYEHNILNSVRLPEEEIEIEGLSGLDTLKYVLRILFEISID